MGCSSPQYCIWKYKEIFTTSQTVLAVYLAILAANDSSWSLS